MSFYRDEDQNIALKYANNALEHHTCMLDKCMNENNDAEFILSGYLIKNDSVNLQREISQLQNILKKYKAYEQIHNLKKYKEDKENDQQQGTKRLNEIQENRCQKFKLFLNFITSLNFNRN